MIINLGDAPFKAYITVTYPKGDCTVSNGTTVLSHSGGGTHTFTVNKKGTWTVTAQYSTAVKTASVEITYRGQVENVALDYTLLLYNVGTNYVSWAKCGVGDSGYFNAPVSPSYSFGSNYMEIYQTSSTKYASGFVYTEGKIDLTPYTKLKAVVSSVTMGKSASQMAFEIHSSFGSYVADGRLASSSIIQDSGGTFTIDLSSIKTTAYVCIRAYWGIGARITNMQLEV